MNRFAQSLTIALQAQAMALFDTQPDKAEALKAAGLTRGAVISWRRGKRGTSVGNLIALLDIMGYELRIVEKPSTTLDPG